MQNTAILGAGLIGRLLALLLKDEYQISLYEQTELNDSSTTGRLAAAMVAPTAESVIASDHIVTMGQQATELWPALLTRLELSDLYQNQGTLVVAHRQDQNELQHFKQRLTALSQHCISTLTQTDINKLEPELSQQFSSGLFIPDEGQVDNKALYLQTEQLLRNSNVELFEHTSVNLEQVKQKYDWVIDCRGLGSKAELVDNQAQLRGVRGEVVRLRAPEVNLSRPIRIMHPKYPIYIAPKPDHEFVIGATEIESEDDKAPTVRSSLELLSAAYTVHKGFAEAEVLSIKAGLRPTLLDNEPMITKQKQLLQVNGLYRHGYLIAPYLLQQLMLILAPHKALQSNAHIDPTVYREIV